MSERANIGDLVILDHDDRVRPHRAGDYPFGVVVAEVDCGSVLVEINHPLVMLERLRAMTEQEPSREAPEFEEIPETPSWQDHFDGPHVRHRTAHIEDGEARIEESG